jgi:hypothetical protein
VFKPSDPRMFLPASGIAAVAVLVALGIALAGGFRPNSGSKTANQVATAPGLAPAPKAQDSGRVRASLAALPLAFEANQGQTDPQVKYVARGRGYTVFLTANDTVFAVHSSSLAVDTRVAQSHGVARTTQPAAERATARDRTAAIHLRLDGGNPQSQIIAGNQLPGHSNYFLGADRRQWHANVPQYARICYREAYPGVEMAFYGAQKQLEFDFIVAPGASPDPIRFDVSGALRIVTDPSGNLILASSAGDVLLHQPVAYQQKDGVRQPVDARFVLRAKNQVSFELGNYDRSRELVIDPSVTYATYLGGTGEDDGNAIAVDGSGNAYVTGETKSTNFPGTSGGYAGGFDVFVTKLSANGSTLEYSTYVGGSGDDSGNAIALDASGDAFVAGGTASPNFPVTSAPLQKAFGGGSLDAFVFELSSSGGSPIYSTYLGGSGTDVANGIALATDGSGDVFVVGRTTSTNFPTTKPTVQPTLLSTSDGFVTRLNPSSTSPKYSTYLGGSAVDFASAVAVDSSDNAYVTGATASPTFPNTNSTSPVVQAKCGTDGTCNGGLTDAFVSVIKADGSGFVYSTFLGGEANDEGSGIALDSADDAYVTGVTSSTKFPLQSPLQKTFGGGNLPSDAFVSELNPTGAQLVYSTYLGGSGDDAGLAIAVDSNKNAYVTGVTGSTNFPTASPTQPQNNGENDAFVSEISAGGSALAFSTYLGGKLNENTATSNGGGSLAGIAVDSAGANVYVTGSTNSTDFPTVDPEQPGAGGTGDAFVAKYSTSGFTVTNGALSPTSGIPGVSATATITVTSMEGFNSAVTLACSVAPVVPKAPTCSFTNPGASVTPPANGSVTATLNLATTASAAMLERPLERRSSGLVYAMLLPIGAMMLLGAGLGSARTRRRKWFGFLMLGMLLSGLLLMPACSSNSSGGGGGNDTGTPTGTYTITVTGTSGSNVATGSPALSLTVN